MCLLTCSKSTIPAHLLVLDLKTTTNIGTQSGPERRPETGRHLLGPENCISCSLHCTRMRDTEACDPCRELCALRYGPWSLGKNTNCIVLRWPQETLSLSRAIQESAGAFGFVSSFKSGECSMFAFPLNCQKPVHTPFQNPQGFRHCLQSSPNNMSLKLGQMTTPQRAKGQRGVC